MTIRFVKPNPIMICSNPKPSNMLEEMYVAQDAQFTECKQSIPAIWDGPKPIRVAESIRTEERRFTKKYPDCMMPNVFHESDCAVHNAPAEQPGDCNCTPVLRNEDGEEWLLTEGDLLLLEDDKAVVVLAEKPKTEMNVYYFTFGCGQKHHGEVQPIYANNMMVARNKMFELFGDYWAFSYTEEEWNKWKKQIELRLVPCHLERERQPVYVYSEESEG